MDFSLSRIAIEELLEHFVVGALGLALEAPIRDLNDLPSGHLGSHREAVNKRPDWAAWQTNRGPVSACATYDQEQSQHVKAYVLLFEWWIPPHEHHKGWWYCYPKRPRDWIKGAGEITS